MTPDPASPQDTDRSRRFSWRDPVATAAGMQGRSGLEFLRALAGGELPAPPIFELIGGLLVSAEPGHVVFELDPHEFHYNPIGSVHGGIIATLLDSACGCAVQSVLPEKVGYTSLDLSVKYLRAVRVDTGRVIATGTLVHSGRRTALASAELRDGGGTLLATATSSCVILPMG